MFHSPQAGHLPSHLGDSLPQFLQKKVVLLDGMMDWNNWINWTDWTLPAYYYADGHINVDNNRGLIDAKYFSDPNIILNFQL